MKKLFNIALAAILAISFTGCKEQSSFEVSDIKTTATIMGTLSYDLGQDYINGKYVKNIVPASGKRVYVEVENSEYVDGGEGVSIYETTTDDKGAYSISVPVTNKGAKATVKADPFIAQYKEVINGNNNQPIFNEIEAIYNLEPQEFNLMPNSIKFCDKVCYNEDRKLNDEYKYHSTFIVKVGEPKYYKEKDEENGEDEIVKRYIPKANLNVLANVNDVYYAATTDSEGKATFVIPSKKENWSANIKIETQAYVEYNFAYLEKTENKDGEVEIRKQLIESGIIDFKSQDKEEDIKFSGIENDKYPVINVALKFVPHNGIESYNYEVSEWDGIKVNL